MLQIPIDFPLSIIVSWEIFAEIFRKNFFLYAFCSSSQYLALLPNGMDSRAKSTRKIEHGNDTNLQKTEDMEVEKHQSRK